MGSTRGVAPVAISTVEASTEYGVAALRRDQHLVGVTEGVLAQRGPAGDHVHPGLDQLGLDVAGLGQRELLDPLVDRHRVDRHAVQAGRADAEPLVVRGSR